MEHYKKTYELHRGMLFQPTAGRGRSTFKSSEESLPQWARTGHPDQSVLRNDGSQLVLIGTGNEVGQVLAFRARVHDDASAEPPQRRVTVEDVICTGLDEQYAKGLIAVIVTQLEPNYPDLPYALEYALLENSDPFDPTRTGAFTQTRTVAPLDALGCVEWLEKEGIEIANLPVLDRERMITVEEGERTFELHLVGKTLIRVRGVTRDTLGMGIDVRYELNDGVLRIESLREKSENLKSLGQYLLALGLYSAVKAAGAQGDLTLVTARMGFYQYDLGREFTSVIFAAKSQIDTDTFRPEFIEMVEAALSDARFELRIKSERPDTEGSDQPTA